MSIRHTIEKYDMNCPICHELIVVDGLKMVEIFRYLGDMKAGLEFLFRNHLSDKHTEKELLVYLLCRDVDFNQEPM